MMPVNLVRRNGCHATMIATVSSNAGCSSHMSKRRVLVVSYTRYERHVVGGDKQGCVIADIRVCVSTSSVDYFIRSSKDDKKHDALCNRSISSSCSGCRWACAASRH